MANTHSPDCDYHCDQYDFECTCGAAHKTDADDLAKAISEFERALPGWWWSVCSCSVSRDASCAPDRNGRDADLLASRDFDNGFHCDHSTGSAADALRDVMAQAIAARLKTKTE